MLSHDHDLLDSLERKLRAAESLDARAAVALLLVLDHEQIRRTNDGLPPVAELDELRQHLVDGERMFELDLPTEKRVAESIRHAHREEVAAVTVTADLLDPEDNHGRAIVDLLPGCEEDDGGWETSRGEYVDLSAWGKKVLDALYTEEIFRQPRGWDGFFRWREKIAGERQRTEERDEAIAGDFLCGRSIEQVAADYGLAPEYVSKQILTPVKRALRSCRAYSCRVYDGLRSAGFPYTRKAIAAAHEIDPGTLRRDLERTGVEIPSGAVLSVAIGGEPRWVLSASPREAAAALPISRFGTLEIYKPPVSEDGDFSASPVVMRGRNSSVRNQEERSRRDREGEAKAASIRTSVNYPGRDCAPTTHE